MSRHRLRASRRRMSGNDTNVPAGATFHAAYAADLASARANRVKAQEQLNLARENQKLVGVSFNAGAATYLEVADANAALLAAETGSVGESISASLAALRVLKAAGRFANR